MNRSARSLSSSRSTLLEPLKRLRRIWISGRRPSDALAALIADGTVEIGAHSYGVPRVLVWDLGGRKTSGRVIIGRYCSIAGQVTFLTGGNHRTDFVSTYPFRACWGLDGASEDGNPYSKGDIRVGHDVWIGEGASVLSGVAIGHGAVVAAYSVVADDVPPYTIVGGVPARAIRQRFTPEQIEALLRIAWWDWPEAKVLDAVPLLNGGDVQAFIDSCA
jgi:acetyltransferase-like isoleucine patch superfamily enzyme